MLLETILKMAILIGIGFIIAVKTPLSQDIRKFLIMLIINVVVPALILHAFLQLSIDNQLLMQILMTFVFSVLFNLISLFAALGIAKAFFKQTVKARETAFLSALGNTALIGIPLCATLFGPKGAILAAVFDAGMALILWSLGVMLIQQKGSIGFRTFKSMFNMPLLAILIGFLMAFLKISPPHFVKDVADTVGYAATPLAMFYIGMLIMSIVKQKRKISPSRLALPIALKLVVFPIASYLFLMHLSLNETIENILLIQVTMPTLSTAPIVMAMNHADDELGAVTALSSTVLSLVSIPMLVYIGKILIF